MALINETETNSDEIYRKDTASFLIELSEEIEENGIKSIIPIDITNCTIKYNVKKSVYDADTDAVISKEITSHFDPTSGKTAIELTTTDTDIEPDYYQYSILLITVESEIITLIQDNFIVKQRGFE